VRWLRRLLLLCLMPNADSFNWALASGVCLLQPPPRPPFIILDSGNMLILTCVRWMLILPLLPFPATFNQVCTTGVCSFILLSYISSLKDTTRSICPWGDRVNISFLRIATNNIIRSKHVCSHSLNNTITTI